MPPRKRNGSGLTGASLAGTMIALKELVKKSEDALALSKDSLEVLDEDRKAEEKDLKQLQAVLEMLQTKIDGPQVGLSDTRDAVSHLWVTEEDLAGMNISFECFLKVKPNPASNPVKKDTSEGDCGDLWSEDMLVCYALHLNVTK